LVKNGGEQYFDEKQNIIANRNTEKKSEARISFLQGVALIT